jgi:peroxidase
MEAYGILPLTTGYATDYDARIDPSVSNAFAAAAFRMGHTLIQGILK